MCVCGMCVCVYVECAYVCMWNVRLCVCVCMWFHYPGLLLHTELIGSLFIRCTVRCEIWVQPAELPRYLCLECRVSWVRVPPEAAHIS